MDERNKKQTPESTDSVSQHEDLALKTTIHFFAQELLLYFGINGKVAYEITQHAESINPDDIRKVEAVLYIMADKFLDSMDMDEILEGISMTKLGQKLVNKGKAEGIAESKLDIAKSLIGLLDVQLIAERLELPLETVLKLKEEK